MTRSEPPSTQPQASRPRALALNWHTISLSLSVLGIGVAGYLTYVHYNHDVLICAVGNCERVQSSRYSEIAGIPIALLGLGMYVVILGLGMVRNRRTELSANITAAIFALVLAGAVYAAYLTYLELAVIHAICQWCVASAMLTFGILLVEGFGLYHLLGVPADR